MRGIGFALGLTCAALSLELAPRDAAACTTSGSGIDFLYTQAEYQATSPDDVIAVAVAVFDLEIVDEVQHMSALLERDDGVVTPAELLALDLSEPAAPGVAAVRPALLVVRPSSALEPDANYELRILYPENGPFFPDEYAVMITTSAANHTAPTLTSSATLAAGHVVVDERMCCETAVSSCGTSYRCERTRIRKTPSVRVEASITVSEQAQGLPWVARVDDEGATVERRYPHFDFALPFLYEDEFEAWTFASADFPIAVESGVDCFVAGVTDLWSLKEERSEPFCVDTDAEALPPEEILEFEPTEGSSVVSQCIGPWIPESVGEGEPMTGGCTIGGLGGPTGLIVLVLVGLRRRRRGPTSRPREQATPRGDRPPPALAPYRSSTTTIQS